MLAFLQRILIRIFYRRFICHKTVTVWEGNESYLILKLKNCFGPISLHPLIVEWLTWDMLFRCWTLQLAPTACDCYDGSLAVGFEHCVIVKQGFAWCTSSWTVLFQRTRAQINLKSTLQSFNFRTGNRRRAITYALLPRQWYHQSADKIYIYMIVVWRINFKRIKNIKLSIIIKRIDCWNICFMSFFFI